MASPQAGSASFALALGGGGARGLAHIHVIEALDELGIRPTAIAGSSIGAIMGAGMAAGMKGTEIHAYARDVLSRRSEVASRVWKARPQSFKGLFTGGISFGQFNVERVLNVFLPSQIPQSFEELSIPLFITATDYYGHRLHVCDSGELVSALGASAAIPAMFKPVRRDGKLLIDGGIFDPVPFDLILDKADITIAIDVVGGPFESEQKTPNSIDLMFGSSQLMMQSITANMLQKSQPTILLRPPVSRFRMLDFLKIDAVMAETASLKDDLKRAVEAAISAREQA